MYFLAVTFREECFTFFATENNSMIGIYLIYVRSIVKSDFLIFIKWIIWVVLWLLINFLHLLIKSMLFALLVILEQESINISPAGTILIEGSKRETDRKKIFFLFQCFFLLLPRHAYQESSSLPMRTFPAGGVWLAQGQTPSNRCHCYP